MSEQEPPSDAGDSLVEQAGELISGLMHSVPAVVMKNALKAVGRLSTAAVSVPAAWLEGKAAETKAASQARVKLIRKSSDQIAHQMRVDPEYVRAAASKFAEKIVRERANLDQITEVALKELDAGSDKKTPPSPSAESISDDWLNIFENEAAQISSANMQALFGKILAGEITKPSSFSIKTVKLVAQLDQHVAILFKRLCSLSISLRHPATGEVIDARVASLGGNAASNALLPYGLPFDALNILQEHGLIIADFNSYMGYEPAIARDGKVSVLCRYAGQAMAFASQGGKEPPSQLRIHGVALTRCGREMLPVIEVEQVPEYTEALKVYLRGLGLEPVGVTEAKAVS